MNINRPDLETLKKIGESVHPQSYEREGRIHSRACTHTGESVHPQPYQREARMLKSQLSSGFT
jgi:hypothetical protein